MPVQNGNFSTLFSLILFPDDSRSQWIYRYDGDEFRLLDFVDTAPDE